MAQPFLSQRRVRLKVNTSSSYFSNGIMWGRPEFQRGTFEFEGPQRIDWPFERLVRDTFGGGERPKKVDLDLKRLSESSERGFCYYEIIPNGSGERPDVTLQGVFVIEMNQSGGTFRGTFAFDAVLVTATPPQLPYELTIEGVKYRRVD